MPSETTHEELTDQLQLQRRAVDFDTYDITIQQLLNMLQSKSIDIAPTYQRKFRWDDGRASQLVESFFLGIPVPSLFMATNRNASWELVDGVQRLSSLVKFAGQESLRSSLRIDRPLRLQDLEKLTQFNGKQFNELPESVQLQFNLRPVKVVTLSDKSDEAVRFDLFERLNTGGVNLTHQEIRDCVYRGEFSAFLDELAIDRHFQRVVRVKKSQTMDGTREECVLRFFAFRDRYLLFDHSVKEFLNDYMRDASRGFDFRTNRQEFKETFQQLAAIFPAGITRPSAKRQTTPLNLYEGVAVGAALALQKRKKLVTHNASVWLGSTELTNFSTGPTNDRKLVRGRIEYCRDRFLGK